MATSSEPFKRQGSLRRVLPSTSNGDSMVGMSAKMIERPRPPEPNQPSSRQSYSQYFQEYSLISEYNMLVRHHLPGLYVTPSAQSALLWFAVMFVRKGMYQGGIFRFNLIIPETFPDCGCPRVSFESKVFHPSINSVSGEMEVMPAFSEWKKDVNRLWQVLHYVVEAFHSVNTKHPVNIEAATLYDNSQEEFVARVNQCVDLSLTAIYDPPMSDDPYCLKFDVYNEEIHGTFRKEITSPKEEDSPTRSQGLSWVLRGSLDPFSRAHS